MAPQTPGAGLIEAGASPGGPEAAPEASADLKHATAELLERLLDDLTFLVQTVEARHSKRNLNAFTDALKRVDYVRPYEELP